MIFGIINLLFGVVLFLLYRMSKVEGLVKKQSYLGVPLTLWGIMGVMSFLFAKDSSTTCLYNTLWIVGGICALLTGLILVYGFLNKDTNPKSPIKLLAAIALVGIGIAQLIFMN